MDNIRREAEADSTGQARAVADSTGQARAVADSKGQARAGVAGKRPGEAADRLQPDVGQSHLRSLPARSKERTRMTVL